MKTSKLLLILGLVTLLIGAIMAFFEIGGQPFAAVNLTAADYVLLLGALLIIFRGAFRARERDNDAG